MIAIAKADGSIIIDTHIDTSGFSKSATNLESQFSKIGNAAKKMGELIATAFSVTAVIQFGKEASQAAMSLESAMLGLESIVEGQGRSFAAAQQFINEYISDGLIPAENAVTAYKNLAARGYDDTQIQQVMTALKDASAFGRQASLSMGEAVQGATEGLKNENSVLVDNAGVTKNVSKMWEEYAASIGTTASNLTQAQKIQAEVNGILAETQYQTGDAAKAAGTLSGQISQLSFNLNNLKVAIGNIINPIVQSFLPAINNAIAAITKFANDVATVVSLLFGEVTTSSNTAADAIGGVSSGYDSAANSANDYASAIAEASKETKKSLAGFDELNRLQSNSESESTGTGTLSGGGTTIGTQTGGTSAETTVEDTISPKLQEIAERLRPLKEALEDLADAGIEVLRAAIEGLKPLGEWLWNDFIVPLADFLGFDVEGIESLADALSRLADWIEENSEAINNFLIAVAAIAGIVKVGGWIAKVVGWLSNLFTALNAIDKAGGAWIGKLVSGVKTAWGWISGTLFPAISSALSAIASALGISVGWVVAIIAAVIAAVAAIIIFWDEIKLFFTDTLPKLFKKFQKWLGGILDDAAELFSKAWESIKDFFSPAIEWFSQLWESVSQTFEDIFYNIGVIASGCWEVIKKAWSIASDWFKKTVVEPVANWFSGMWDKLKKGAAEAWDGIKEVFSKVGKFFSDTFKAAWEKVKKVFSPFGEIFVNIKDGILKAFKEIVNGLIRGLNNVIAIPFDGINSALKFIKNIEILGLTPFANLRTISVPKIPYLAQGAVIPPNAPFMAVLGDQRNGTNIEAPADLIRQIVREELAGGASNDEIAALLRELIQVVMGIQVGDEVIGKAAARYNRRVSRAGGY